MTKLCPKCLDTEEVVMKRISVSKAISKNRVSSLFLKSGNMYLPYQCPECGFKEKYQPYRWHFLEGSWICKKCMREEEEGNIRFQSEDVIKSRLADFEKCLEEVRQGRVQPAKHSKYAEMREHYKKMVEGCKRQLTLPLTKRRDIQELEKSVKGNIIEVRYRCLTCGNEWTTKIRFYP